jgi:hypothetical protein
VRTTVAVQNDATEQGARTDTGAREPGTTKNFCPICHHYHGEEPGACWADVDDGQAQRGTQYHER